MNEIKVYRPNIPNVTASQWDGTKEDAERIIEWVNRWGGRAVLLDYPNGLMEISVRQGDTYQRAIAGVFIVYDGHIWFIMNSLQFRAAYDETNIVPIKHTIEVSDDLV